jgi:KDO2-lipid IV(A) lauroyltransferase
MVRLLQMITRLAAQLPLDSALKVGRGLGWLFGSVMRYHRTDAFDALRRGFPEKSEDEIADIVQKMYANLGMNVMELCRLLAGRADYPGDLIRYEGTEHVAAVRGRGNGMLGLSAHTGNWELICGASPECVRPLTIIAKSFRSKTFSAFWAGARERFGLKMLPPHNSYRECLRTLRRNEVIGFMLDQNMIASEGVFVNFFGRPACTTPGLAYLSAHAQAPVVPVFMVRDGERRHRCIFHAPIEPPPNRDPETIREFTQNYTSIIERMIRERPDQWIWIHRRWKTQPKAVQG